MVDMGFVKATNKIVLAGDRQTVELEVETATNMYPGRTVEAGGTNNEMVVGTAGAVIMGWLSYEDTPVMYKPATIDTIYKINDRAAYVFGPGIIVVANRKASETIVMGDKLVAAADGQVAKWTPVPISAGTAEEDVIAVAMEDGSGTASDLIVRSLI
jgi:hypothetical protein